MLAIRRTAGQGQSLDLPEAISRVPLLDMRLFARSACYTLRCTEPGRHEIRGVRWIKAYILFVRIGQLLG